jgi:hypothetical protein
MQMETDRRLSEVKSNNTVAHGVKRHGDDSLLSEQRLAKRLGLLSIGKIWVFSFLELLLIVQAASKTKDVAQPKAHEQSTIREVPDEYMAIDETSNRIFINDIDAELSDDEEEKLIFLPDIEKRFMRIPKSVLTSSSTNSSNATSNELVLYNVPSSITIPESQDSVKKAIIETRARQLAESRAQARAQAQAAAELAQMQSTSSANTGADDEDMDIG